MFCKIINVFRVTFDQLNACFILHNPNFWMVVYHKNIKQQKKKKQHIKIISKESCDTENCNGCWKFSFAPQEYITF